jgi:carbohydrate kinase (thermoresistant glucokinase family)
MRILVMGVAGVGKSTVGAELARQLRSDFVDADALHSDANRAKMAAGIPLNDADRAPWLDEVGRVLSASPTLVVTCSALKHRYRDRLRTWAPYLFTVHLTAGKELLMERLAMREGHLVGADLLPSQLETLELLSAEENGIEISADADLEAIVERITSLVV